MRTASVSRSNIPASRSPVFYNVLEKLRSGEPLTAEEKRGLIRWLRPDYRNPTKASDGHPFSQSFAGTSNTLLYIGSPRSRTTTIIATGSVAVIQPTAAVAISATAAATVSTAALATPAAISAALDHAAAGSHPEMAVC